MTKVYLVTAEYRYESNGEWKYAMPEQIKTFTNRKLAEVYAEYWNLKAKKRDKKMFGEWRYKVQENQICNIDYGEDLLKEQIDKLPY